MAADPAPRTPRILVPTWLVYKLDEVASHAVRVTRDRSIARSVVMCRLYER